MTIRTYHMIRKEDESGVSGTGLVGEIAVMSDGTAILHWLTDLSSIVIYKSLEDLTKIHSHGNKTIVVEDNIKSHA